MSVGIDVRELQTWIYFESVTHRMFVEHGGVFFLLSQKAEVGSGFCLIRGCVSVTAGSYW